MTEPEPPEWLSAQARIAFANAHGLLAERDEWHPIYATMLAVLATSADLYVRLVCEVAELPPDDVSDDLRNAIAEQRGVTRELMRDFGLIASPTVGAVRSDGLDHDIAELCDITMMQ